MSPEATAAPKTVWRKGKDSSGPARRLLSKEIRQTPARTYETWTKLRCVKHMARLRWGSHEFMPCPHCGTVDEHPFCKRQLRWRCRACRKRFSATSGTMLSNMKLRPQVLLDMVKEQVVPPEGRTAISASLKNTTAYNTAFVNLHKLREGLVSSYNVGFLVGDVEMDGSHIGGRNANGKRGRPQGSNPIDAADEQRKLDEKKADVIASIEAKNKGKAAKLPKGGQPKGAFNPEFGQRLPPQRRILEVAVLRSGVRGMGAIGTRVTVAKAEDVAAVAATIQSHLVDAESRLNTDTSPAYQDAGRRFIVHSTVEHAKMLRGPGGENNNQAESIASRFKRGERLHRKMLPKYILNYGAGWAFLHDVRALSVGQREAALLRHSLMVGPSPDWTNFCRGNHRDHERLVTGPEPVKYAGPPKGRMPLASNYGRRPK
jgi:hypothetical protein